jgi:hypothetical protein
VNYPTATGTRLSQDPNDFDLSAAWFRKAQGDLKAFIEAFAVRMEGSLPGHVVVDRRRDGLFSKQMHVEKVSIRTEAFVYLLAFEKSHLSAHRSKEVRGITLKSETLPVGDWLEALNRDIVVLSERAGSDQDVLQNFLMS